MFVSFVAHRTPFIDLFLAELVAYRTAGVPLPLSAASKEKERSLTKGARKQAKQKQVEQVKFQVSYLKAYLILHQVRVIHHVSISAYK